jgi:hypothetical protein
MIFQLELQATVTRFQGHSANFDRLWRQKKQRTFLSRVWVLAPDMLRCVLKKKMVCNGETVGQIAHLLTCIQFAFYWNIDLKI